MNILISGGSKGLGLYLTERLLEGNNRIATFARKETQEIVELRKRYSDSQFLFDEVDIVDYEALRFFVNDTYKKFGEINCLINNAAIGQDHLLSGIKNNNIADIINVNLSSTIILTKFVVKKMLISRAKAQIISISSICAEKGFTGLTVYSATKGGLISFTKSLARELGGRKILVNSISPGFFESEMSNILSEEQLNVIKRRTATGELVTPKHIFNMLSFLLKQESNITGQNFIVDGGSIV